MLISSTGTLVRTPVGEISIVGRKRRAYASSGWTKASG
jgi:hypothetical protein